MKILLVDLSAVAVPIWEKASADATDPNDIATAIVGRVRTIAHDYEAVVVCCDSRTSWRKEMVPTYKANRPERPEGYYFQLDRAKGLLANSYVVLESAGFEADDIIATVVRWCQDQPDPYEVTIASYDKDLLQLVSDMHHVRQMSTRDLKIYDEAAVKAKFGVRADQMRSWLTFAGDSSDGVPHPKGIGPKTAQAILANWKDYGTAMSALLNTVLSDEEAGLGGVRGATGLRQTICNSTQMLDEAWGLVGLRDDVPIPWPEHFPSFHALEARGSIVDDPMPTTLDAIDGEAFYGVDRSVESNRLFAAPEPPPIPEPSPMRTDPCPAPVVTETETEFDRLLSKPVVTAGVFERGLEPKDSEGAMAVAQALFRSGLFPKANCAESILAIILLGRGLGLGVMAAMQGIKIGKGGSISMSADLMVALCLRHPDCEWFEPIEQTPTSSVWACKRRGRPERRYPFTWADAEVANLTGGKSDKGPNMWATYPTRMLSARAKAYLARDVFPDVVAGLYTSDEVE